MNKRLKLLDLLLALPYSCAMYSWNAVRLMRTQWSSLRGLVRGHRWNDALLDDVPPPGPAQQQADPCPAANPLKAYFDAHHTGRGVWKWEHYFEIYQRHLQKFVGREVHLAEVGVYSGGSLEMWKDYFGPACRVYGIDIADECKVYEDQQTKIFIGDQADLDFWHRFREAVPRLDILIDDGGHRPDQQIATLEAVLPYMAPGAVFICEDIYGANNRFAAYLFALLDALNIYQPKFGNRLAHDARPLQQCVYSAHFYPFIAVIEKRATPLKELIAPKHGTQWQPFYREGAIDRMTTS